MTIHVRPEADRRHVLSELEGKLDRIVNLAGAASIVIEHQLGRDGPAAILDSLLAEIEEAAREAEMLRSQRCTSARALRLANRPA